MAIFNSYVKLPEGRMEEHDNGLAVLEKSKQSDSRMFCSDSQYSDTLQV